MQAFILKPANVTSNSITPGIKGTSDIPTMVARVNDWPDNKPVTMATSECAHVIKCLDIMQRLNMYAFY